MILHKASNKIRLVLKIALRVITKTVKKIMQTILTEIHKKQLPKLIQVANHGEALMNKVDLWLLDMKKMIPRETSKTPVMNSTVPSKLILIRTNLREVHLKSPQIGLTMI